VHVLEDLAVDLRLDALNAELRVLRADLATGQRPPRRRSAACRRSWRRSFDLPKNVSGPRTALKASVTAFSSAAAKLEMRAWMATGFVDLLDALGGEVERALDDGRQSPGSGSTALRRLRASARRASLASSTLARARSSATSGSTSAWATTLSL
jgi:hypothetical protein